MKYKVESKKKGVVVKPIVSHNWDLTPPENCSIDAVTLDWMMKLLSVQCAEIAARTALQVTPYVVRQCLDNWTPQAPVVNVEVHPAQVKLPPMSVTLPEMKPNLMLPEYDEEITVEERNVDGSMKKARKTRKQKVTK